MNAPQHYSHKKIPGPSGSSAPNEGGHCLGSSLGGSARMAKATSERSHWTEPELKAGNMKAGNHNNMKGNRTKLH